MRFGADYLHADLPIEYGELGLQRLSGRVRGEPLGHRKQFVGAHWTSDCHAVSRRSFAVGVGTRWPPNSGGRSERLLPILPTLSLAGSPPVRCEMELH